MHRVILLLNVGIIKHTWKSHILGKLRQEDYVFKASLGTLAKLYFKMKQNKYFKDLLFFLLQGLTT